jgi:DNA-binding response OmpR family regulator
MAESILIIDDDQRLAEMLASYLSARGFTVEHRADARSGQAAARAASYDAIILDVMLPDRDGFDLCRELRSESPVPILMLTARGEDMDRIVGLELGADDYLPKPFNPRELVARLGAIFRRARRAPGGASDVLRFGPLTIDRGAREVRVDGERRELTGRQFNLLLFLAERAGRVQSREQIQEALVGEEWESVDRSIDVQISRIRSAIEADPRDPRLVQTVRGVGYVLTPPPTLSDGSERGARPRGGG